MAKPTQDDNSKQNKGPQANANQPNAQQGGKLGQAQNQNENQNKTGDAQNQQRTTGQSATQMQQSGDKNRAGRDAAPGREDATGGNSPRDDKGRQANENTNAKEAGYQKNADGDETKSNPDRAY